SDVCSSDLQRRQQRSPGERARVVLHVYARDPEVGGRLSAGHGADRGVDARRLAAVAEFEEQRGEVGRRDPVARRQLVQPAVDRQGALRVAAPQAPSVPDPPPEEARLEREGGLEVWLLLRARVLEAAAQVMRRRRVRRAAQALLLLSPEQASTDSLREPG